MAQLTADCCEGKELPPLKKLLAHSQ